MASSERTVWPAAAQARLDQALTAGQSALATVPDPAPVSLIPSAYDGILAVLPWLVLAWAMLVLPALLRVLHGIAAAPIAYGARRFPSLPLEPSRWYATRRSLPAWA